MNKCDCPYQITFYISCPCHLLDWMIWLFIAGFLITGRILMTQSEFYFYTDENNQPVKICTIRDLELWRNYDRFFTMICSLTGKMKETILLGLKMDYIFMFFAYGGLYLLGRAAAHCLNLAPFWLDVWRYARWLPILACVMDITENIFTALLLSKISNTYPVSNTSASSKTKAISKTKAQLQRIASALKWLFVIINLLVLLLTVVPMMGSL